MIFRLKVSLLAGNHPMAKAIRNLRKGWRGNPCEGLGVTFRPKVSLPAGSRPIARAIRNLRKGWRKKPCGGLGVTLGGATAFFAA